ncbi:hypothetical protein ACJ72_04031 [Emergomyces africanus]|uniref:Uncharacterized protein n=1 Tax=Emergomyces africanus TaxID=1955775 RepID=A0A1B7NXX8_9EURO|nr:hypothetical protein ACJ72_04031 [Emergomyces africanus]
MPGSHLLINPPNNDEDDVDPQIQDGHETEEDAADIVVNRVDADFPVKPGDNRVLKYIHPGSYMLEDTLVSFKMASDGLRKLFKRKIAGGLFKPWTDLMIVLLTRQLYMLSTNKGLTIYYYPHMKQGI